MEVVERLVEIAKALREARHRHEQLGLSLEEAAFYDALAGSAEDSTADPQIAAIATELVKSIRADLAVDWADRESSEAAIRRKIKRLLREHDYQPRTAPVPGHTTSTGTRSSCSTRPRCSTAAGRRWRIGCSRSRTSTLLFDRPARSSIGPFQMPNTKDMSTVVPESQAPSPSEDLATLLSTLPAGGVEDDVSRLIEVYEAAERVYRDASLAGMPVVGSSSSANL